MPLPSYSGAQQAGVSSTDVQKMLNQNQKVSEVLSGIEARLSNITNLRTSLQSGMFEAFGNNFLTRGMSQLTDSIGDTFKSLFGSEESDEDKSLDISKASYLVLKDLYAVSNKYLDNIDYNVYETRKDMKEARLENKSAYIKFNTNLMLLRTALLRSSGAPVVKSAPKQGPGGQPPLKPSKRQRTIRDITDEVEEIKPATAAPTAAPDTASARVNTQQNTGPEDAQDVTDKPRGVSLLSKILDVLIKSGNHLAKMVGAQPLSSAEAAAESAMNRTPIQPVIAAPTVAAAASVPVAAPEASGGIIGSIVSTLADLLSPLSKAISAIVSKIIEVSKGLLGLVFPGMRPVPTTAPGPVPTTTTPVPTTTTPVPTSPPATPSTASKVMSGIKKLGGGVLGTVAGVGLDYAGDKLEESGNTKTAAAARIGSSAVAGAGWGATVGSVVPVVGTGIGAAIGGVAGAGYGLYKNAGSLFGKSEEQANSKIDAINAGEQALAKETPAAAASAPVVINNQSVVKNQTIVPVRPSVANTDPSLNRYLDSIMLARS